jgi:serine/threonine protein kinase/DNA-binding NarL/FixJ family response regulator
MVFILLASADEERGAELRESLGAQGWWITLVGDREGALRAAADHEPEVVVVDAMLPGAAELVRIFSSRNGGPGALVLGPPEGEHESLAFTEAGADELLSSSPAVEEVIRAIQRVAAIPHRSSAPGPLLAGRQLTAEEIFGDILTEIDGEAEESEPSPEPEFVTTPSPGPPVALRERETGEEEVHDESALAEAEGGPPPLREAPPSEDVPVAAVGAEGISQKPSTDSETPLWSEPEAPAPEEVAPELEMPAARGKASVENNQSAGTAPADSAERNFGQYRLEERIAVGGMAEVWRASMVGLEGFKKTVAIKKILPHLAENDEFVAMFVDEAKLAAQLSHENLVDIYDLGRIDSDFFIAMEYVDGKDLRSILNRLTQSQERMPLGLALFIAARTAAALDYAHTRRNANGEPLGLVHRDVSPRNILISHSGNVRLCDFGVAKAVSSVGRTEIGALKGKIPYMSPEQAAGAPVDCRSDVFSLASVLFEIVTGRRLFVEDNEITLLDAVRRGVTDAPRAVRADLPEEVSAILERALSKDPAKRYQTAGELQLELDAELLRLSPVPTQVALAGWLGELLESKTAEASGVDVVEAVPEHGMDSAVSQEVGSDQRRSDGEGVAEPLPSSFKEETVETKVTHLQKRGRRQFWLGVAAGLLVAVLLAMALEYWLDRRSQSLPPTKASEIVADQVASAETNDHARASTI